MIQKTRNFLFKNTSTKQTLAKNTFWLFISDVLGKILRMGLIVYAARTLGVEGWGVFSYATSIGVIIMTFSDIGISGVITREAIQKKEGYKNFITTAILIKSILLILSIILILTIGPLISDIPEALDILPIIAFISLSDSLRELCFSVNNSFEKMEREAFVKTLMNIIILISGIILLKMQLEPKSLALAYAIGGFLGFIIIAILVRKDFQTLIGQIDKKKMRSIFNITWPFTIISLAIILLANIDTFMLGIWKNAKEIGLYASVQRLYAFIAIIPSTISVAIFPAMSKFANLDKNKFRILLEKTISIILLLGIPIALGGILLSKEIILLVFGQAYIEAIPVMTIMMSTIVFSFPLVLISNAVFAHNQQKSTSFGYVIGILANILFNLILIPKYGAFGATIATLVSTTIIFTIVIIKLKKINYFQILPAIKKLFIPVLLLGLFITFIKTTGLTIIPIILISFIFYIFVLFILKEPIIKDIKSIGNI